MQTHNTTKDWSNKEREEFLNSLVRTNRLDVNLKNYLIDNGFLECPASGNKNYHGCYPGGLFEHCVEVFNALSFLTEGIGIVWGRTESVGNIAFGHDVCKLDNYIGRPVWDLDGNDENRVEYEYNRDSKIHGHGMKSVILCQQAGVILTEEEMYCILYHMGAYEKEQWEAFDKAIKRYPAVLYTHTADMHASKIVGV